MYEKSRNMLNCHIAGFAYCDGLEVIDQLKIGAFVALVAEPDNPYDSEAVAVYFDGVKLGYLPRAVNSAISTLIAFGHADLFEVRISHLDLTAHDEKKLSITVKVVDRRK